MMMSTGRKLRLHETFTTLHADVYHDADYSSTYLDCLLCRVLLVIRHLCVELIQHWAPRESVDVCDGNIHY